jgi:hypothetical protein
MTPPVPIGATATPPIAAILFDQVLRPGILQALAWSVRYDNVRYVVDFATAAGSQVDLVLGEGESDPGPDIVDYTAILADVRNLADVPAVAFYDFPIT